MEKTENTESYLICLFTQKPLRLLNETELEVVNQKIANKELSFFEGAPCKKPVTKAYSTNQYLYIYPEIDGVLYLKRATTIVAKNRVEYPLHRREEAENDNFYKTYSLSDDHPVYSSSTSNRLTEQELKSFKSRLKKEALLLFTSNACSADDVLNTTYGMTVDQHIHADYDLARLKSIQPEIPYGPLLVLIDQDKIPVAANLLDGIINFEPIDQMEKEKQIEFYKHLKSVLKPNGVLVSAYDVRDDLYLEKQLFNDIRKRKAIGLVAPWKKPALPKMYFIETGQSCETSKNEVNNSQTSLSRQLG